MECIDIVLWRAVEGADQRNLRLPRSSDAQLGLKVGILDAMNSLILYIFFPLVAPSNVVKTWEE